jgi:hypothetical protein
MFLAVASRTRSSGKISAERLCDSSITYHFMCYNCSSSGSIIELKMKGGREPPCLTPIIKQTSDFDPLYSIFVLRPLYECIIDSRSRFGSPRRFRPA